MLIQCSACNVTSETEVISQFSNHNENDPSVGRQFSFLKCPSCCNPVVMESHLVWEINGFIWGTPVRLFPVSKFHINPAIPKELRNALLESAQCYEAALYTPTVIMCRRTLDGFCQLMGVSKKLTLDKALKKLQDDGYISPQLYEWATLLRNKGNEAAHDINSNFTETDAKDLLDFTIAILDFSYSFKDKFEKFKLRQDTKSNDSMK